MDLKSTQLKDTYGNLLTIGTTAGSPTSGTLQNGDGEDITALDIAGTITADGLTVTKGSVGQVASFSGDDLGGARALQVITSTTTNTGDTHSINAQSSTGILKLSTNNNTERLSIFPTGDIIFRDTSNNPSFYWDASAGSLGIGTSPSYKLDVESSTTPLNLNRTGGATALIGLDIEGTNRGFIGATTTASFVSYSTAAAPLMTVLNTGNVGIGTDDPSARLNVAGALGAVIGGGNSAIRMTNTDTSNYASISAGIVGSTNGGMDFSVDGTRRMVISGSGNVGIGTEAPAYPLSTVGIVSSTTEFRLNNSFSRAAILGVNGNILGGYNVNGSLQHDSTGTLAAYNYESDGSVIFYTSGSAAAGTAAPERMRIDSSGNVGIGNTPTARLQVGTGADALTGTGTGQICISGAGQTIAVANKPAVYHRSGVGLGLYSDYAMSFEINGSTSKAEAMRIDSSGNILFGGITGLPNGTSIYGSAFRSDSNGRMGLRLATSSSSAQDLAEFFNPNGLVGSIRTNASATSYLTSSDYRLKENVVEMTGALDRVDQLKPSRFNFIADADTTVDGFLAHEVANVVPEAISGEKDAVDEKGNPIYQGIDQSKLVPLLVGAIQELRAEIEQLKNQ